MRCFKLANYSADFIKTNNLEKKARNASIFWIITIENWVFSVWQIWNKFLPPKPQKYLFIESIISLLLVILSLQVSYTNMKEILVALELLFISLLMVLQVSFMLPWQCPFFKLVFRLLTLFFHVNMLSINRRVGPSFIADFLSLSLDLIVAFSSYVINGQYLSKTLAHSHMLFYYRRDNTIV